MKKRIYKKHCNINGFTFIKELPSVYSYGRNKSVAEVICPCGNTIVNTVDAILNLYYGECKLCTDKRIIMAKINSNENPKWKAKIRQTYYDMKRRCYDTKYEKYKWYGGSGIKVSDEFKNNFNAFYEYVIHLDNYKERGYSLDRIDNNGNYERGNLRWANKFDQACNRRLKIGNKTGFNGIYTEHGKWFARIRRMGINHTTERFCTLKEAVDARNKFMVNNNIEIPKYENTEILS